MSCRKHLNEFLLSQIPNKPYPTVQKCASESGQAIAHHAILCLGFLASHSQVGILCPRFRTHHCIPCNIMPWISDRPFPGQNIMPQIQDTPLHTMQYYAPNSGHTFPTLEWFVPDFRHDIPTWEWLPPDSGQGFPTLECYQLFVWLFFASSTILLTSAKWLTP